MYTHLLQSNHHLLMEDRHQPSVDLLSEVDGPNICCTGNIPSELDEPPLRRLKVCMDVEVVLLIYAERRSKESSFELSWTKALDYFLSITLDDRYCRHFRFSLVLSLSHYRLG